MDIFTASHYLKAKMYIRRYDWEDGVFLKESKTGHITMVSPAREIEHHSLSLKDLLANDWELFNI
jgi:hypothetical protein